MHTDPADKDQNSGSKTGFETKDIDYAKIKVFMFAFFAFAAGSAAIGALFFYYIVSGPGLKKLSHYPRTEVRVLPQSPVLQANPRENIRELRYHEMIRETSYGWDPTTHHLYIPIAKAMQLVESEGLPTRANPAVPDANEPNEPAFTSGQATEQQNTVGYGGKGPSAKFEVPVNSSQQMPSEGAPASSSYRGSTGDNSRY